MAMLQDPYYVSSHKTCIRKAGVNHKGVWVEVADLNCALVLSN